MVVAVYLTLALIYLVIAARSQESGSLAYLLFVAVALGAAGTAVGELALGRLSNTPPCSVWFTSRSRFSCSHFRGSCTYCSEPAALGWPC